MRRNQDRLELSARVLEGWEAMDGPLGTPTETLRLIAGELLALSKLRPQAPAEVDDLVRRYQALADQCRTMLN